MFINIALGALIFGYAGWSLFRFIQKSRQGKCAACSIQSSCDSECDDLDSQNSIYEEFRKEHPSSKTK